MTRAEILANLELERLAWMSCPEPTTAEVKVRHAAGLDSHGNPRPTLSMEVVESLRIRHLRPVRDVS